MDEYKSLSKIAKVKGEKVTLPKGLIEAADRAEVFSVDDPQNDNNIKVDLEPGRIRIKGMGQYGWYSERKKVQYKGKSFSFMIKPKMLIQLVKGHTECEVTDAVMKAESGNAVFVTSMSNSVE